MKKIILTLALSLYSVSLFGTNLVDALGKLGCCDWFSSCDVIPGNYYAYGDWLYWNLRRSGLDYAVTDVTAEVTTGTGTCFKRTDVGFNSAYRIGAGYKNPCGWGVEANYTFYSAHDQDHFVAGTTNGGPTRGDLVIAGLVQSITSAHMRYDVSYKVLDVLVGYDMTTRCFGIFRPFMGGRFAWISEKEHTFYQGTTAANTTTIDGRTSSKGYGLVAGLDYSNCFFCQKVGIFAALGYSVMYGDVEANFVQSATSSSPIAGLNLLDCQNRMLSTLDIALGLEGLLFQWCGFTLHGRFGYEFHQWWNMIDFINLTGGAIAAHARNQASFGIDGLVFRLMGKF